MRSDIVEKWDKINLFFNSIIIIDNKLMGVIVWMDFLCFVVVIWMFDFWKKVFIVCRNKMIVVFLFKYWFCLLFNIYLLYLIYVVWRKFKIYDFIGFWVILVIWVVSIKCCWFLFCVLCFLLVYNIFFWKYI